MPTKLKPEIFDKIEAGIEQVVDGIIADLNDRRDLHIDSLEPELQAEIKKVWKRIGTLVLIEHWKGPDPRLQAVDLMLKAREDSK
jgi:hypothetical protein